MRRAAGEQKLAYIADIGGAAGGRAAGHAHAPVFDALIAEQAGIGQRLLGSIHTQIRHAPHAAQLFARPMCGRRIAFDGRAQLCFQIGILPLPAHILHGIAPLLEGRLNACPIAAESRNAADAADHNSVQHNPPFTEITCRVM